MRREGRLGGAARTASLALLCGALAAPLALRSTYEPDLFWHLAQGREAAAGRLVTTNLFSATHADFPQPATSWLFDLGAYELWQGGGAAAVQGGLAAVLALSFALLLAGATRRASLAASLAVLSLGWFVVEARALPRPHTLSFAGMAACALVVELAVARRSALPLLWSIPIVALWSNFHVECYFGVALLALFAGGEVLWPTVLRRRQALAASAVVALAAAASLANPYGTGLLRYLWENAGVPSVIRIAELQPPYLPNYATFFVLVIAGAAVLVRERRRLALWEPLAFAFFAWLALSHLRFTALFVFAVGPLLAARAAAGRERGTAMVAVALFAGLVTARLPVASYLTPPKLGGAALAPADLVPVGAMEFSRRAGLDGPVFNSNNIGGYIAWERYPDVKVFQDSRLQSYPSDHFRRILDAWRSQPAWDAMVAPVDWAVLSRPRPNELSGAGRFPRNRWATVYWDEAAEVLVRRGGKFDSLRQAHEYVAFLPERDPFQAPRPAERERFLDEARRNLRENPEGFAASAVLCLHGDDAACANADRLAAERPGMHRAVARLQAVRTRSR